MTGLFGFTPTDTYATTVLTVPRKRTETLREGVRESLIQYQAFGLLLTLLTGSIKKLYCTICATQTQPHVRIVDAHFENLSLKPKAENTKYIPVMYKSNTTSQVRFMSC